MKSKIIYYVEGLEKPLEKYKKIQLIDGVFKITECKSNEYYNSFSEFYLKEINNEDNLLVNIYPSNILKLRESGFNNSISPRNSIAFKRNISNIKNLYFDKYELSEIMHFLCKCVPNYVKEVNNVKEIKDNNEFNSIVNSKLEIEKLSLYLGENKEFIDSLCIENVDTVFKPQYNSSYILMCLIEGLKNGSIIKK